jgi:hypothetical protein
LAPWLALSSPGSPIACGKAPRGRRWRGGSTITFLTANYNSSRKLGAINIGWQEYRRREIYSYIDPRGYLTRPGMPNHMGDHADQYRGFPFPRASPDISVGSANDPLLTGSPPESVIRPVK